MQAANVVREEVWIEALYGQRSTLPNELWLERVTTLPDGMICFSAAKLREKLFEQANIEVRHHSATTSVVARKNSNAASTSAGKSKRKK